MRIDIKVSPGWSNTENLLRRMVNKDIRSILAQYGDKGVTALAAATPVESGETANSWYYEIERVGTGYTISWLNRHMVNGANIAVLLQYGHGTGTGGYVEGRDYINPAIQPLFDQMATEAWKAVMT